MPSGRGTTGLENPSLKTLALNTPNTSKLISGSYGNKQSSPSYRCQGSCCMWHVMLFPPGLGWGEVDEFRASIQMQQQTSLLGCPLGMFQNSQISSHTGNDSQVDFKISHCLCPSVPGAGGWLLGGGCRAEVGAPRQARPASDAATSLLTAAVDASSARCSSSCHPARSCLSTMSSSASLWTSRR